MAFEQQFRVYGPVAFGTGTTAAVFPTANDWSSVNFAGTGGVLEVPFFSAAKIRGIVNSVGTAVLTTAPVFTTTVFSRISVAGATGTARVVDTVASVPIGSAIGTTCFHYFSDDDIRVNPGEMVIVRVSTAAGTGAGWTGLLVSEYVMGPTSGGTVTVPVSRPKVNYGPTVDGVVLVTSTGTGNN